jgi:ARG/rhodanese/phosphatase superfamily protein
MRTIALLALIGCSAGAPDTPPIPLGPPPPPPRAPIVVEVAPPRPASDLALGGGFELRRPIEDERLALIPIVATSELPGRTFVTLQGGMVEGVVVVQEAGDDFQQVLVTNRAREPLVILGGEVIVEGHQDRMVARDTVVPPGGQQMVHVWCVELGRSGGGARFAPGFAVAEYGLRSLARRADQLDVWERVAAINEREGLAPPTKTYRYAAKKLASPGERRDRILTRLGALEEHDRMIGFAVAIDHKLVAFERFGTPGLYQQLEAMLVASYLPASRGRARTTKPITPADVRAFVQTSVANGDVATSL